MSSTNDREGLIKKAAIAIRDAWALRGGVRGADVAARAAVAVFEKAHTAGYSSVVEELDGLIDSLDEHVTIEDVGLALGELRANVFERAKAEKAHTPTVIERHDLVMPIYGEPEPDREGGNRCGHPHPHYSSLSCGREPGHDDSGHSYGIPAGFFSSGRCWHYLLMGDWTKAWCIRSEDGHTEHETASGIRWMADAEGGGEK